MSALANEFSWSHSRHETFQTCLKRYYFAYYASWGGWDPAAPARARELSPDLVIGNSKGYRVLARDLNVPLIRVGFPIHDRFGAQRVQHLGYAGAQILFDRIVNAVIDRKQTDSDIGYGYI